MTFDKTCIFRLQLVRSTGIAATALALLCAGAVAHASKDGSQVIEKYGRLPISFEANQGQAEAGVQFLARGRGYSLLLMDSKAVLALESPGDKVHRDQVQMSLAGARKSAKASGEELLPGKVNYFIGKDPAGWRRNLPTYGRVRYNGVYPGVDLVYYGNQRQLEYDFVVAPGADTEAIQLNFSGEKRFRLEANGDLALEGARGTATLQKPVVYQDVNGRRLAVEGSFAVRADGVGFKIRDYDRSRPLIIDPVLVYSTYLGGSGSVGGGDQGNAIAVDGSGNAYVTGQAYSIDFPVTSGVLQPSHKLGSGAVAATAFVSKLNAGGTALLYSTYLGGSAGDYGYGIALDGANNAYVTGATASPDFPIVCNAFQSSNLAAAGGATTAFVAELSADGSTLLHSTFLGGSGNGAHGDVAQGIALDGNGNIHVAGYTYSADFPVSKGAFQGQNKGFPSGRSNAFVTTMNAEETGLISSTYLGGGGGATGDYANGIAVDGAGNSYVAGGANSGDFPVTKGAYQPFYPITDLSVAFVTELNAAGTAEVYSTYLGGSYGDFASAIAVSGGFVYVAGTTHSNDFPVTDGVVEDISFRTLSNYGQVGFVTKLSTAGSTLAYSTYLGGTGLAATGLAVDSAGVAYITGTTPVSGFATSPDALATPTSTASVAFVIKLNAAASAFNYATLLGSAGSSDGTAAASGNALALDAAGNVYVTGYTTAAAFPTTTGAFQTSNHATATPGTNAFVSSLALASELNNTAALPPPALLPTEIFWYSGGFSWIDCPNTWSIFLSATVDGYPDPRIPTGTMTFYTDIGGGASGQVDSTGYAQASFEGSGDVQGDPHIGIEAVYSGDGVFAGTVQIGPQSLSAPYCDGSFAGKAGKPANEKKSQISGSPAHRAGQLGHGSAAFEWSSQGPKFTPRVMPLTGARRAMLAALAAEVADTATCAPLTLTVTLHPLSRLYGAANPTVAASFSPSVNAETLVVTDSTAATSASPVGTYPLTATLSGPGLDRYATVKIVATTLYIRPAPLYVAATSVHTVYGIAPGRLAAYTLNGLVNGDSPNVVLGTPVLSATVTHVSPVGPYPITVTQGSMHAANYYFAGAFPHGYVVVGKRPLTLTAFNRTMWQGGAVPNLTYWAAGFANGETVATATTGTPVLSTTATPKSVPKTYPIYISLGTLKAPNYSITLKNGVMTVEP